MFSNYVIKRIKSSSHSISYVFGERSIIGQAVVIILLIISDQYW